MAEPAEAIAETAVAEPAEAIAENAVAYAVTELAEVIEASNKTWNPKRKGDLNSIAWGLNTRLLINTYHSDFKRITKM